MTTAMSNGVERRVSSFRCWLDRPLASIWCVIGWLGASVVFYGLVGLLGGPAEGDASESVYSTWSIAHGDLACAYPHLGTFHFNDLANPFALVAPLYVLITGAASALLRIGHDVAFPSRQQFGSHCGRAFTDMFQWSIHSSAILPTVRLSYLVWPILMVGTIALVRASGRGRRGWEPFALLLVACMPTVLMCLTYFFHPEDVLAMGLILFGVALALRRQWFWCGVLLGLACCAQQFAFLVGAPLLVVATGRDRVRFFVGAIVTALVIDVPLIVATSGRAIRTILLGSSRVAIINRSTGGTVLWETHVHGLVLFFISRVAPIAVSMLLAWWAARRLGPGLLGPVPMMSLVASALALRLVFEENLFGYYFMAISVALILLEVARGRFRGPVLAWLALVTVAFNPVHEGFFSNLTGHTLNLYYGLPIVVFVAFIAWMAIDAAGGYFRPYKFIWILIVSLTCESRLWGLHQVVFSVPNWLWQLVLVPSAFGLAVWPLLSTINLNRSGNDSASPALAPS